MSAKRKAGGAKRKAGSGKRKQVRTGRRVVVPALPLPKPGVENWELSETFRINREELGKMVRLGRLMRGWSTAGFAFRMGLRRAEAIELECGQGNVDLATLTRLAVAFGGISWRMWPPVKGVAK